MTNKKSIFLISKAVTVEPSGVDCHYDSDLQLNVLDSDGITPLVDSSRNQPTMSKTQALPGDDDPDPGQDRCY